MQAYLPIIQDLFFQWYQFTLDNAAYAAALAISVWLLTVLFYWTRIAFINRRNRAKAKEAQNSLDAAQQQTQKLQEELSANTARMQESEIAANTATQRALDLERRITEHNMQLNDSLRALTISFNLDRPTSSAEGDLDSEGLWQQYSAAIAQLTERLRAEQQTKTELQQAYQAETAKLTEKETLLETLQAQLDAQTHQLARLEKQNALLQQQISDTAQKQHSDLARLAELEKLAAEWAHAKTQQLQLEEKIFAQNILIAQLEKARQSEQIQPPVIEQQQQAPAEPEETVSEAPAVSIDIEQPPLAPVENHINDVNDKIKHLFGGARQQTTKLNEEVAAEPVIADQTTEEPQPVLVASNIEIIQAEPASAVSQLPEEKSPKFSGKLKHMFGNAMQQIAKLDEKLAGEATTDKMAEEPRAVLPENAREDIQPESPSAERQPSDAVVKEQSDSVTGKIRNLFGTRKSSAEEPRAAQEKQDEYETLSALAAAQQLSNNEANNTDGASKKIPTQLKSLFRKFQPNA
jgi:nicotinamide mononucleotide adenylyltransferase